MANAEKLKRCKFLRQTEYNRVLEIHTLAQEAKTDANKKDIFRVCFEDVQTSRTEFYKSHNSIISLIPDDPNVFKSEDDTRKLFDSMCNFIKAIYYQLFLSTTTVAVQSTTARSHVRLPKIEIPTFTGDVINYISYIDMYNTLIHNSTDLTNVEKFNYLLSSLKGDALAFIRHIPVTDANYALAYDELNKRYKNDRLILKAHWDALEASPKVHSDKAQEVRNLLDTFSKHLKAIDNFALPKGLDDFILFQMLLKRLDSDLITRFELQHNSSNIPTFSELQKFLENYWSALGNVTEPSKIKPRRNESSSKSPSTTSPSSYRSTTSLLANTTAVVSKCLLCSANHAIYRCPDFLNKSSKDRYLLAKAKQYCINCLSSSHFTRACNSPTLCHKCHKPHHTALHFDSITPALLQPSEVASTSTSTSAGVPEPSPVLSVTSAVGFTDSSSKVLLSTARVEVLTSKGTYEVLRVLLDSGSQSSFISKKAFSRLGFSQRDCNIIVNGLGQTSTKANVGAVTLSIKPIGHVLPIFHVEAVILPKICESLPSIQISLEQWSHFKNKLPLADPTVGIPSAIDILLGADVYSQLLAGEIIRGSPGEPDALKTVFGYVLTGKFASSTTSTLLSFFITVDPASQLDASIQKLWELDTVPQVNPRSPEDIICEKHFLDTHYREDTGRFVVSMPFRDALPAFPESRTLAVQRFLALERRLQAQPHIYQQYSDFMREYLNLDHMEPVIFSAPHSDYSYYLPHTCVIKPDSLTTKLRVVFNASASFKGRSSLNDHLWVGPKLQRDIFTILLNFRLHAIVLTADIRMMYRQILIDPGQRDYQRIVWRFSPQETLQDYRLTTVTYGVNCSPFLSIRVLLQLAEDDGSKFPLAASALQHDTYIDDIVTGASSLEDAVRLKTELVELLHKGCFELRKWASNDQSILKDLPSSYLSMDPLAFEQDQSNSLKILGLQWNPSQDCFTFTVCPLEVSCTKRNLLSNLARVFDPMGILSPFTFVLKHLIQRIWSLKLDWDSTPPNDIVRVWENIIEDLSSFSSFSIPRRLLPANFDTCELHGFADSSEKGYCAVIYFVFTLSTGEILTSFVCSKSKVAPLKRISIPTLELCAAVLLTRLVSFVCEVYQDKLAFSRICAWSDSTTVLTWIKSSPHRWKTFVSNRVTFIQDHLPIESWSYVSSSENPADVGSRGLLPTQLTQCALWWAGVPFLKNSSRVDHEPTDIVDSSQVSEEEKTQCFVTTTIDSNFLDDLLETHSKLHPLVHIVCYVRRFIFHKFFPAKVQHGPITAGEFHEALLLLAKRAQQVSLSDEIRTCSSGQPISKHLQKLSPFVDGENLLRVGGRLSQGYIPFETRFPVILPASHRFTTLLIEYTHQKYFHAGIQTIQFLLSSNFWILSAKHVIRKVVAKCVRCFRCNPFANQPPMGNLPAARISKQVKPFIHSGVDYAGPFSITMSRIRGAKKLKAYLCLFVCFSTRAVHLELATDMSADTFLAALQRFVARRGRCEHLYSDCGTNFLSASRHLNQCLEAAAATEGIKWHFGGLWEAGVKSVKTHLLRVMGDHLLTYEELSTLLARVEAMLNSRPLTPVSTDPNDLQALSPGHFLTFAPLVSLPEPDLQNVPLNTLSRWQLVQRLARDIWTRWSREYLHTLHQRSKWFKHRQNIEEGSLVLLKDEMSPPLQWRLARVVSVHPGADGVVRVATVKTSTGLFKRPVVKLCQLPQ